MVFNFEIGTAKADNKTVKVNYREAVKAVIIRDNIVLMVNSNKGDYKFPGGGMENGETHEQTVNNDDILKNDDKNEWVYRETLALKEIRKVTCR